MSGINGYNSSFAQFEKGTSLKKHSVKKGVCAKEW